MSDFIRKHGRPDINCMKNGSQGSCWFLLLNREKVSLEKSVVFLCWSEDIGDVAATDCVYDLRGPFGVEEGFLVSSCLDNTRALCTLQISAPLWCSKVGRALTGELHSSNVLSCPALKSSVTWNKITSLL